MIVLLIVLLICGIQEMIIFMFHSRLMRSRKRMTMRSLYKLMEERVLFETIKNNMTREEAAAAEYQSIFLRIEFPDTKPWLAYLFALDEYITVGRSRDNKIAIYDDRLSRHHCKIAFMDGRLYLQDLGSANGTAVKRGWFGKIVLLPQQMELLEDDDTILVGSYRMKIKILYGYEAVE